MPENNILLEAKEIKKIYGQLIKTVALKGINLQIQKNEFITLIGPSGCGKTTLANILGALDQPTSGTIYYKGSLLAKMKENQLAEFRNQHIGFIFQFHFLLKEFTALENVLIPTWIKHQFAPAKKVKRAKELLEMVGLKDRMYNKGNNLSGGQQQRVAIARSLINEPGLILADEPTGNLDSKTGGEILELLRRINREDGTTIIVVTHDERVKQHATRSIEMIDGKIIDDRINGKGL